MFPAGRKAVRSPRVGPDRSLVQGHQLDLKANPGQSPKAYQDRGLKAYHDRDRDLRADRAAVPVQERPVPGRDPVPGPVPDRGIPGQKHPCLESLYRLARMKHRVLCKYRIIGMFHL
ncbi:hypothetical protein O3G_MSEX008621 [Manduca sexta]|uniref:Uncharacterized protein n=1 Tax=Manduca sexta TaxID=7130 RepID=A0A921ZB68_MANSE|nr:hypothetical protein O3G_MSEX008621 [Manduca sexta]